MVKFKPYFDRRYRRIERIIAIIALINLGIVFWDLTYFNIRPFYRQYLPGITQLYDPVKGILVSPEITYYQAQVDQLTAQFSQASLPTPEPEDSFKSTLAELRVLSQRLIEQPLWVTPWGGYAWATIQQNIRTRTGEPFASDAFNRFWSVAYLEQQGWQSELAFWHTQMRPLLQAIYSRRVHAWGGVVDYFGWIDLPFVLIFAVDLGARLQSMRRRYPNLTWLDMALRRWYDLFLLLPFWRWLRVLPVVLRLYQVDWLDLESVKAEIQRDTIILVGADLAGIVGIQIIDHMQDAIRNGELLNGLSRSPSAHLDAAIAPRKQQQVSAIANELYTVGVHQILPRIQPDVEDLVQYSLASTLKHLPGYLQLNYLPGLDRLSDHLVQYLSNSVVREIYHSLSKTGLDAEGVTIITRLQHNLRDAIADELHQHNTLKNMESLLLDMLEQIKLNYVKAIATTGGDELAKQTELLRKQVR